MWFKKTIEDMSLVDSLKKENQSLQNEVKHLQRIIADINNEIHNTDFAIDWKAIRAFSVERNVSNNMPATIIGYFVSVPVLSSDGEMVVMRDEVKEWTLRCSDARHRELVAEFRKFNAKNN